jgi:hypothetical protein
VNPLPTTGTIEYTTNIEDIPFLGLPWKISQQKDSASLFSWGYHVSVDFVSELFCAVLLATQKLLGVTSIPTENIHSFSLKGNMSRDEYFFKLK